jgi:hypothetical protein
MLALRLMRPCAPKLLAALFVVSYLAALACAQDAMHLGDGCAPNIVVVQACEEPPVGWEDAETGERFFIHGNNHIALGDPAEDPRISAFDVDDSGRLFYTWRPNLLGIDVPDEWDFYNLINTDRPDFTDATYTVGKGVTLLETGYTFRKTSDHESNNRQSKRSLPESLLRYGVTNELELRVKWNGYVASDLENRNTGERTQFFGADDLYFGFKYEVWQQEDARPMLTFLSGTTIPSGTNGISSNQLQPFVNWVLGYGLRRWLYVKASTGIDWQKTSVSTLFGGGSEPVGPIVVQTRDNVNIYHGSVSLLFQVSPRVGGFAEFFSLATTNSTDNRPANFIDTGMFYYVTPHVQLDARIGQRLGERVDEVFAGAGFSTRW